MKSQVKREDGQFAITTFVKAREFENGNNDRVAFCDACDTIGEDGTVYSAPKGFARWTFQEQQDCVCLMFGRQPVVIEIPVNVDAV